MTKGQSVGDRIAQARREKGVREHRDVRAVDVARALGVSGPTVSDWESGKIKPRDDTMLALAEFLGVTPGYLRFGEGAHVAPVATGYQRLSSAAAAKKKKGA